MIYKMILKLRFLPRPDFRKGFNEMIQMIRLRNGLIFFGFIGMLVTACTEKIEVELDDTYTRLVVEGAITTDTTAHTVRLSTTSSYFYNQPSPPVSGARVSISDGNVSWDLQEVSSGVYVTEPSVYGVPGNTYTLKVELKNPVGGYSEYTASSKIYPVASLDSINLVFHDDWSESGIWEIQCYVMEPPTVDFYRFMVSKNETILTDTLNEWVLSDDKFYNGNYTNGLPVGYLDQGDPQEMVAEGGVVGVEINNIGSDYFNFIVTAQIELFGSNPLFSGPPANIPGNISNGGFGYFAAYSVTRSTEVVPAFKK
jgi:hypothetical protein